MLQKLDVLILIKKVTILLNLRFYNEKVLVGKKDRSFKNLQFY